MQVHDARQLAADILGELAAFNQGPHGASWPDSLWPEMDTTAPSIPRTGENEAPSSHSLTVLGA